MSARGYLGAGDLYIDRIVGGVKQGREGPFEVERFEIKANAELRERVSKSRNGYGQVVASASLAKPFDLSITMGEADKTGLAIALLGTAAAITQASGSLTAVSVTASLDKWVTLTKARLTGAATVTNTAASTTYVEGTDYEINREMGWFKAKAGGAITAAQDLKLTSTYAAIAATEISGATASSVRAEFTLDGKNLADDTPTKVTVFEGVVSSDAAIDFLSDQFLSVPLPGRLITPSGQTTPFKIELRDAPV